MSRLAAFVVRNPRLGWVFVLVAAVSAAVAVNQAARDARERERLSWLNIEVERRAVQLMSQTMNGNQMGAIGLLGLIDANAKQEALNARAPNGEGAAALMENIARAHDADGAYIVGKDGIIKSSWGVGKPLTGVDVRFRPYFQSAIKGRENVYAAVGTTTGRRNLYFAAPLRAGGTKDTPVIGAVVMRSGVVQLDKLIAEAADMAVLLSPQGVVYAASREEWIGRVAEVPTPDRLKAIRELKQFGNMFENREPAILPVTVAAGRHAFDGRRFAVASTAVKWNDPFGDWTLVLYEDLARAVPQAEAAWMGVGTSMLVLVLGILVFNMLRSHHAQRVAAQQINAYAEARQAGAERKAAVAAAALKLQQAKTPEALAQVFLAEIHALLGALQGVVYVDDGTATGGLRLLACYACAAPPSPQLAAGEGLLGQCAIERRVLVIETPQDGIWTIRSGLGGKRPAALMMAPILMGEIMLGVAEVATLEVPDDAAREQFMDVVGLLGMNLEILRRSRQTEEILAATVAAERAGADQLAFQQALLDTIPYPMFYKGADTRFLGVNRAYEQAFGIRREDLLGKRVMDVAHLPEAERNACQAEDEAAIASADTIKRETKIGFVDGQAHDTLYFASGFRRQDGSPGGLVGTFIDISQLRNAERELDRLADAERFNRLAHGREQRILELKQEINRLASALGRTPPYAAADLPEPQREEVVPMTPAVGEKPLSLADLVDLGELQRLFTAFCESVGIAAAIIDLEGNVLASARWQRACTDFHRVNPESCARCIESDTELALKLQEGRDYTMYTCKNGMTDCASPIVVEGRHLANVFIGQFHLGPPDMDFFRQQARHFGYPEVQYLQAITEAPVADETRLPTILGFLSGFARLISTMSLARRRADEAQARLEQQAELLQRQRIAAISLAEDAEQARLALEHISKETT